MSNNSSTILGILILIIITGFKLIEYQADKTTIQENLEKKKAKNITMSKNWLDFDRGTRTFNVSYTDVDGKQHSRVCKLHYTDLYWDDENE